MMEQDAYKSAARVAADYRAFNASVSHLTDSIYQARIASVDLMTASAMVDAASARVDFQRVTNLRSTLTDLSRSLNSPAVELAKSANSSISTLVNSTLPSESGTGQVLEKLQRLDAAHLSSAAQQAKLYSQLSKASEITILAQSSLATFPWSRVGSSIQVPDSLKATVGNSFLDFSRSYTELYQYLEQRSLRDFPSSTKVSELPSVEFFNGADLMRSISVEEVESEFLEEEQDVKQEIRSETEDALQVLLADLDPDLIQLLQGSRQALESNSADHVRHFTISSRELFTHVLHRLAPDDEVRAWSTSPNHFCKNRPTRRARLLYICREVNQDPFSKFVEKDVESALECLNLIQQGTHGVAVPYTSPQLLALKVRMETTIRFMLEISRSNG